MAPEKSPAFQFYPKDFLMDGRVSGMSLQERGAYITLLCLCWLEHSLPAEPEKLARMVGLPLPNFRKIWIAIAPCFTRTETGWTQKRLEQERKKQDTFREVQRQKGLNSAANRKATSAQLNINRGSTELQPDSQPKPNSPISDLRSPIKEQERKERASLSPSRDPFTEKDVTERAGRFIERYQALYQEQRKGAKYAVKPARDYAAAVTLCETWPDARLDKLAVLFLVTDHKFAEEGSRTIPQFLALASWCDGKLADWDAKNA